jgi:hypothetical protein
LRIAKKLLQEVVKERTCLDGRGGEVRICSPDSIGNKLKVCRFSRSSTGCFSRMFVMGRTQFSGLGDTLIGEGAVA